MKNTVKRATSLFMAMLMILSTMISVSGLSLAADIETETEPNDASNTATVIPVDTVCEGNLKSNVDEDWYKFTNEKNYFTVDFLVDKNLLDAETVKDGWKMAIYTENGEELKVYSGITSTQSTAILPVKGTFLIKVEASWNYEPASPVGCTYGLKVNTVKNNKWESEWNNTSVDADAINTDTLYYGTLHSNVDEDWYKFTTNKDYFNVYFNLDDRTDMESIRDGWKLQIYMGDGKNLIKEYNNIVSETTTVKLPYSGTYYLKVLADWNYEPKAPTDCYYNIKVNTFKDTAWEDEINDTSTQAMKVATGKIYKGALQYNEDVDWYLFDIKSGAFNLEFKLDETTAYNDVKNGWKVEIFEFGSTDSIVTYPGIVSELKSFSIPFNGKILVKVCADWTYGPAVPLDSIYNLKITERSTKELWEKENNDAMTSATKLTSAKKYNANLYVCNDVDCFKYTAKSNGVLKLNFTRDVADNIGTGWKVRVVKADGTIVCEDIVKNSLTFTKTLIPVTKGETLYIKVFADYTGNAPVQVNYQLRVDFTANPGKVTGLKASSNKTTSVKLSWNKVEGAAGYRVYRYDTVNKKYVTVVTTKSTSYTVKNLKAGTSYKFVVKAYKKVDGSNLWGSTSAALTTATTPDTPTLKVTAGKKSATLKWSKETGTGYVVYMATSKNGKYTKIATVKGSSNISTVKKNLTTGKTYYFKVRAYKTVGDSNLYGAYSTVKAVKVK